MPTTLDELISTVTSLNRLIAQRLNQRRVRQSNTQLQHAILQLLTTNQRPRVTAIARQMHLSLPSTTQVLGRLERARLVRRQTDPNDRRSVRFHLTPYGARHLRDLQAARQRELRRLFRGVGTKQLRQMVIVLQLMLKNISRS